METNSLLVGDAFQSEQVHAYALGVTSSIELNTLFVFEGPRRA